jgi:hypothetical protein
MKPEKPYAQLLDFFHGFVTLINNRTFDERYAKQLAVMIEEHDIMDDILENPFAELEMAWDGHHLDAHEKSSLVMFVELGFRLLVAHMRDPQVRELVAALVELIDQNTKTELFARVTNVRQLDPKDEHGPAVITLVVSSKEVFDKWFMDPSRTEVEDVHGSFALATTENPTP